MVLVKILVNDTRRENETFEVRLPGGFCIITDVKVNFLYGHGAM